jgi:hypothetical protein
LEWRRLHVGRTSVAVMIVKMRTRTKFLISLSSLSTFHMGSGNVKQTDFKTFAEYNRQDSMGDYM